jgi:hypothetical protein
MKEIIRRPPKMKLVGLERWSYAEPPKFKRVFPPKMPGACSDWDFGPATWRLDTSTYVSSPSCLKITGGAATYPILCNYSGTTNISQGRLVSYVKSIYNWGGSAACKFFFHFRNQTPLGSTPSTTQGYYVSIYFNTIGVAIARDGSQLSGVGSIISRPSDATQWNKYRVTWWTDPGGAGLIIRLEYWDGSQWVKMINDYTDSVNKYATSSLNRVGIGVSGNDGWVDDTEIWSA